MEGRTVQQTDGVRKMLKRGLCLFVGLVSGGCGTLFHQAPMEEPHAVIHFCPGEQDEAYRCVLHKIDGRRILGNDGRDESFRLGSGKHVLLFKQIHTRFVKNPDHFSNTTSDLFYIPQSRETFSKYEIDAEAGQTYIFNEYGPVNTSKIEEER